MKLSEAILLGSVGTEQSYGCKAILPNGKATCSLGAALFAVGDEVRGVEHGMERVKQLWPWTTVYPPINISLVNICRLCPNDTYPVYSIIWRLNDIAKWTRPQIAAWVAELEKVYDQDPVPVAAPVQDAVEVQ